MFWHIFRNRLKCIARDKSLVFWTLIFPLILGTFFNLALVNIDKQEAFNSIDIAVVNNAAYQKNDNFKNFLKETSQENKTSGQTGKLFNVQLVTKEDAEKLLSSGKVAGYIMVDSNVNLVVKDSGFNQTIIKSVLDEYSQTLSTINSIAAENPAALQNGLLKDINNRQEYTRNLQVGRQKKPDSSVNYFYTLIAMACLYGSFFGLKEISDTQADISKRAARLNAAPVHKLKALIAGLFAALVIQIIITLILLCYLVFILKADFGNQIGYILLTCLVSCSTGVTFGAFIGAVVKKGEGVKMAILLSISMIGSFLAGMMYENMKYIVKTHVPILSYLNPAALITDAFYALYYYDTHTRYFMNIGLLCCFTLVFCLFTYLITRRQKYASI